MTQPLAIPAEEMRVVRVFRLDMPPAQARFLREPGAVANLLGLDRLDDSGIDILRVQEIRSYEQPTRIANAPHFIEGVVNLRGVIVPIIDLRLKLGCDKSDYSDFTVVIVLNVRGRVIGAVVDSVSDVLELSKEQIKPAPELSSSIDANYITGIGTVKSGEALRMLILMDIEGLMSSAEMGLIAN